MPCSDGGSPNLQGFCGPDLESRARADKLARLLCFVMGKLDGTMRGCLFSCGEREAEELLEWWEHHQELDRRREEARNFSRKQAALRKSALAKLSTKEREALDL